MSLYAEGAQAVTQTTDKLLMCHYCAFIRFYVYFLLYCVLYAFVTLRIRLFCANKNFILLTYLFIEYFQRAKMQ